MIRKLLANRWFRRLLLYPLAVLAVIAFVLATAYFTLRNRGTTDRDRELSALDADDPGWRWDALAATRVIPPSDENITERACRIADRFPKNWRSWDHDEPAEDGAPGPPSPSVVASPVGCLPSEQELRHAQKLLTMCRELVPEAQGLRHLKAGGTVVNLNTNPITTLLPHLGKLRQVALLMQQDAVAAATAGRADDALDDAQAILALARGIGDEPLMVSQYARVALAGIAARVVERTLGLGEPSVAKLAEVRDALRAEAGVNRLLVALRGERASTNRMIEALDSGKLESREVLAMADRDPGAAGAGPAAIGVAALLPTAHARYLRLLNRAVTAAEMTRSSEQVAAFAAIERDADADESLEGKGVRSALPPLVQLHTGDARVTALLRATAVMCDLEITRQKTGTLPTTLTNPPPDPFTGKPLLLATFDDGIAVYSTGAEGQDNGGTLLSFTSRENLDVGVRLFAPKHRRRPPPKDDE